jgi:hypothetical protein
MARKLAKKQHEILRYEELEQRLLFSADFMPGLDTDAVYEQVLVENVTGEAQTNITNASDLAVQVEETRRELVFVNENVADYQQLIDDLQQGDDNRIIEVVVLADDQNGIEQVSEILAERDDLDAIHIITHGSDGSFALGSDWLASDDLLANSDAISVWGDALSKEADILLYGCNIAVDENGQNLTGILADLTGADVAASEDITGHEDLGGDWELEYSAGPIETTVALSTQVQASFHGVLDVITFQEGTNSYTGTQDTFVDEGEPDTYKGSRDEVCIDLFDGVSDATTQGLIRFDNIFGSGDDQIPLGSTINSAELTVYVTNESLSSAQVTLHLMLQNWSEASTWNSVTNGVQTDDTEAKITADSTLASPESLGSQTFTGLADTLQAWSDGADNYGWVIVSDNDDGWDFASSEGGTITQRPLLTVDYTLAVNDAPVNTVPATQNTAIDTPLVFSAGNGNAISVADTDDTNAEITLTATNGTLTLSGLTGLSFSDGDGSADTSMSFTGALADINTAFDGLQFDPTTAFEGFASVQLSTTDFAGGGAGEVKTDIDAFTIEVGDVNTAPVNTVPAAQTIDQDGMLLFSSTTGTAISVSDADAEGASVEVTLTASNGTLNLSGNKGLTFTTGDGTADASMTFTGTIADINTALEGMTFVATPDFTGPASLQIVTDDMGNTGSGGALSDTDTVDITVQMFYRSLWVTTAADVSSPSGAPGLDSWTSGEVLQFGNPNLAFEPGTTDGTFSSVFNLDTFAGATNVVIDAIHYVGRDILVGAVTPMQLYAGDVILSTLGDHTYTSTNSLAVKGEDAFVFRPDTPGDYSSGTFILLLDKSGGLSGKMSGITLIEQNTNVGDVTLNAGDFLYIGDNNKTVERWQPDAMGAATSGTETLFIDGADIDIGQNITAVDVIETDTMIGDVTLTAGQILLSLMADDSAVGDAPTIGTLEEDIFIIDLTTTGATTAGTATRFFEGLDVGLNTSNEDVWAFSLTPNEPPVINDHSLPNLDENSPNTTVVGTVTGSDPDSDSLSYAIIGGNTGSAFTINATTGQITVANSTVLDYETTPNFNLTVAAIDDSGAYDAATVTVNLNDINDAPVLDAIGNQSVDELATLTFTATATDSDLPADTLTFSLDAASIALGMSIDANTGDFSWTPTEAQGGTTPSVTITVTDDGTGNLIDSETFTITVADINVAPVLGAIGDQSVDELATLTFTATATDSDLPADTLTFSLDAASIALGMSIDANTGDFSWTPTEAQGGLTPSVTVTVTDNGTGNLIDSETFTITVNDINVAPVLGAIGNQTVDELATLTFTATATDSDLPADTLSFSLEAASIALGMSIDANTGDFSWIPTEAQGGLTPSVTVTVTDDGTGNLIDSETFTITVNDINVAPVLGAIGDQSVDELATLTFTATATDSDLPADTLTFSLDAASIALGMSIDANTGDFSWTPTEAQGGLTPSVTVTVTDSGTGNLIDSETFIITVTDINVAPVLDAIGNQTVDELATLTFTATATDSDLPTDTLTFSLDAASIALGMSIDANTGDFSWTPTETQGGTTPSVTVTVTDSGTGNLIDSETFIITVTDINVAPVLDAIGNQTVDELATLTFTATATDSDLPADTLTFSLDAASIALGMTIDANTGDFSWTPTEAQGGTTPSVTITVTDNGTGNLIDSETFTITVADINVAPVLGAIGNQTVDELATLTFTATATDSDLPADTLTFSLDGDSIALGMSIDANSGDFSWTPTEAQGGTMPSVTVTVTDNGTGNLSDSETFTITVNDINVAPVLGAIGDQSVDELATLSFTATASDSDLPVHPRFDYQWHLKQERH